MHTRKKTFLPFVLFSLCWFAAVVTVTAQVPDVPQQTVDEELRVDDGTTDGSPISLNDLILVNRFTPPRYPATLKAIRIYLRRVNPSPVGAQLRLIVFGNSLSVPSVSFARPANFAITQTVTVPDVSPTGEFVEFALTNQAVISSGDVYVGFQQPAQTGAFFWFDASDPYPMRSYAIVPNGTQVSSDFLPAGLPAVTPAVNVMIRAVVSLPTAPLEVAAVSAATFSLGDVAAGSIVAAFGANLAPSVAVGASVPLPTTLNGTSVRITDSAGTVRNAGLFFVSPGQINLEIPAGTSDGAATLVVTNGSGQTFTARINVRAVVPGLFTANANGAGVPAAQLLRVKSDGSQVYEEIARFDSASNQWLTKPIVFGPESEQAFLVLYGTGIRNRSSATSVRVNVQQLNGAQLTVLYAAEQGSNVGLDQINVALPRTLAGKGEMYMRAIVDARTTNLVKVNFQ